MYSPLIKYKFLKTKCDIRWWFTSDLKDLESDEPLMVLCHNHLDKNRPSMAIYQDHFYCFTCETHGDLLDLAKNRWHTSLAVLVMEMESWLSDRGEVKEHINVEENCNLSSFDIEELAIVYQKKLQSCVEAQRRLESRGLSPNTLIWNGLGYTGNAFSIPVYNEDADETLTIRYRRDDAVSTDGPKYWGIKGLNEVCLFNADNLTWGHPVYPDMVNNQKPLSYILLVEGEFDALLATQEGFPAVSFTNGKGAFSHKWDHLFRSVATIYFCFDQDKAGKLRALEIAKEWKDLGPELRLMTWPERMFGKDITEYFTKDFYLGHNPSFSRAESFDSLRQMALLITPRDKIYFTKEVFKEEV
jgi:DNA primase